MKVRCDARSEVELYALLHLNLWRSLNLGAVFGRRRCAPIRRRRTSRFTLRDRPLTTTQVGPDQLPALRATGQPLTVHDLKLAGDATHERDHALTDVIAGQPKTAFGLFRTLRGAHAAGSIATGLAGATSATRGRSGTSTLRGKGISGHGEYP